MVMGNGFNKDGSMKLSVIGCYGLAWRSFAKWWIPLCLISAIVVVFQVVPRLRLRADVDELKTTTRSLVTAVVENNQAELEKISPNMAAQAGVVMRKRALYALCIFPFVALLTVVLLMYANWAVKNKREERRSLPTLVYVAFVHVMLAIAKLLAFFLFFLPGAYLYIKLLFVSLIMLEEKKGARAAIRISWQMTTGNFSKLFLLVLGNTVIQLAALPTIIGEIPATGFANTARAAAFRMIWAEGDYAET
jgi:hypothetical protein